MDDEYNRKEKREEYKEDSPEVMETGKLPVMKVWSHATREEQKP